VGLFITFEGPEGGGKTTQSRLLAEWLRERGADVIHTREPGGTPVGDRIRAILLDKRVTDLSPEAEVLLFSASRAQLVRQVIRPQLERGGIVVCDRYADSTYAYQGFGRGLSMSSLRAVTTFATGGLEPDLTFLLDLPVGEGLQRKWVGDNGAEWNRFESEEVAYQERVRQGYLELAATSPERWVVLDARQSADTLQFQIRSAVAERLGWKGQPNVR